MKIAVPICDGRFSGHFGGAEAFALYTVDETSREVSEKSMTTPPEHGRGVFPMWLHRQGVTTILAGGMGPRASDIFISHGIDVVLGADGDDPEIMVRAYLDGTLTFSGELCHEYGFHDCGNEHGHGTGGCGGHGHNE
jgi:predicted Fe-Mo cluster-binding NifX family protein